ncbi:Uncharacterized protein APZ42_026137 [Daphnia magna]|uniref:Uncharacterized protein n=1 Tax=Daphnia magna TaxID=35525 RepID=A0A164SGA2_9CRUS|nr:Uncharacterized protein APZ42_026137 [Daphnia magna]
METRNYIESEGGSRKSNEASTIAELPHFESHKIVDQCFPDVGFTVLHIVTTAAGRDTCKAICLRLW